MVYEVFILKGHQVFVYPTLNYKIYSCLNRDVTKQLQAYRRTLMK